MIRNLEPGDVEQLVAAIRTEISSPVRALRNRLLSGPVLAYDDGTLKGCGLIGKPRRVEEKTYTDAWLYTLPAFRQKGIGRRIWESLWPDMAAARPDVVAVLYRADRDSRRFFEKLGFTKWFAQDYLRYSGPTPAAPALEVQNLSSSLLRPYMQMVNQAFYAMRESADIRPFACFTDSPSPDELQEILEGAENVYLYLEGQDLVGAGATYGEDFVDLVAVGEDWRRRGYGRAITADLIARLRRRGAKEVFTCALETNTPALELYRSMGFDRMETQEEARLFLPI